jgi:uncharacterized protein (TIGR02231 family)
MATVSKKGIRANKGQGLAWLLVFLFVMVVAPLVFAGETAITTPKQVTVFPSGARVTREGTQELTAGIHQVVFPDLPSSVIESSLRLTVDGPKGTRLYGVSLRKEYTPEVVEARTRLLKDRIQALQDQKMDLTDKIDARKSEMEILKNLGKESTVTATTHPGTIVDFTKSAGAVGTRIANLLASNRKDERLMRDLANKINALNKELTQGGSSATDKQAAEADLELPVDGTAHYTLTYQVPDASWVPLYDLRLTTEGIQPKMDMVFNAGVRQKTGEDWHNVLLTLSTARPTEGTQVPDPTNWWVDFLQAEVTRFKKTMSFGANLSMNYQAAAPMPNGAVDGSADDKEEEQAPADVVTAETVRSEYAMSFKIPITRDVPSDGSDHRVGISENQSKVELKLVAVPRLSQAAYLEAKVTYDGEQALLAGQAQLFRDGDFVGTTSMESKAPGESFDLGFGQDDQVRVERKAMKVETGTGGFFDFHKGERRYRWMTTVSNYHESTVKVEVREQLPRSRQQNIEVTAGDMKPKAMAEDPAKPGLLRWQLELAPKQKGKVDFSYKVKFPEGSQVSGLE